MTSVSDVANQPWLVSGNFPQNKERRFRSDLIKCVE
jgi:hypothetical protein